MYCNARITENGKYRYRCMDGDTPLDALNEGIKAAHIRNGATVSIGSAQWADGEYVASTTTYQHIPERDTDRYSAWQLVGTHRIEYTANKPY